MKDAKWWREYRKNKGEKLRAYDRARKRLARIESKMKSAITPKPEGEGLSNG